MREHTAALAPPRALWVSFPLGRPLGVPSDAAFQRKVLTAALRLLERPSGPVLEDFPEDAPFEAPNDQEGLACPVSFARPRSGSLEERFKQEMADLEPWFDLAVRERKRSTAALSGLPLAAAAQFLLDFIDNKVDKPYRDDLTLGLALRLACEDVKSYYLEALGSQPGNRSHKRLFDWFWNETVASEVYVRLHGICYDHADRSVKVFGRRNLIPRAAEHRIAGKKPKHA